MKENRIPERLPQEDPVQEVARDLRKFRKENKLTVDEMAALLRVSRHTIVKWEKGDCPRSQRRSRAALLAFREIRRSPDALRHVRLLHLRALCAWRLSDVAREVREDATRLLEITPSPERLLQRMRALLEKSARKLLEHLAEDAGEREANA